MQIFIKLFVSISFMLFTNLAWAFELEKDYPAVVVCFTPNEQCDEMFIDAINSAEKTIRMALYSFTSEKIANALIDARQRNVKVWVVIDKGQLTAKSSQAERLREFGVGVRYDFEHSIQHNKYVIIDIFTTATGSYNYTNAAQHRNAENIIFIKNKKNSPRLCK